MFRHILLPTDGSALSQTAAKTGIRFARSLGAVVTALFVVPDTFRLYDGGDSPLEFREQLRTRWRDRGEKALEELRAAAAAEGVSGETLLATNDQPWRAIIETATSRGCDLILMASHGRRGVSALLLGSETQKVLTHSTLPVLVYR
ncbi:MAG: universal stress protein [Desulfobacterales bacterium]